MRRMFALLGLVAVTLLAAGLTPAPAEAADRGSWARDDARTLVRLLLDLCRDDPGRALNQTAALRPLDDAHAFRQACGAGLAERRLMASDFRVYYHREDSTAGAFEVFGAVKELSFAGRRYQVIIGETGRYALKDGDVTSAQVLPSAYVMQWTGSTWRQVWTYLDPIKAEVVLPRGAIDDPTAPAGAAEFLRGVWRDEIDRGFHRLVFGMKDSRGVPLVR